MLVADFLCEAFPYPPGSPVPDNITDYRDPKTRTKGQYHSYVDSKTGEKRRFREQPPRTHLVLTKSGGVIVYYYSDGNTIDWKELVALLEREKDTIQGDIFGITVKGTGYLLERSRTTAVWGGDRNRYSTDLIEVVRALYERGVANPSTPIWIGNWAGNQGEHVGSVRSILAQSGGQRSLTLYHGTDNFRLAEIMRSGLRPMSISDRVWNKGGDLKQRPEHRDEAVYLTASRPQAEYYAKKAVNIDRVRFGPSKRAELGHKVSHAKQSIQTMQAQLQHYATMTPDEIAREDEWRRKYHPHDRLTIADRQRMYPEMIAKAEAVIHQAQTLSAGQFYGKFEPVILQIILHRRDFTQLMADDDFLARNPEADPTDWEQSLSNFGQIALKGSIPPERIKVIAQGKDAGQVSH